MNLASGIFFANSYEVNYFSGGSSEKYNNYMGPYMMHWHMMNYCFEHGYDRYNFYGLSGDFTENSEDYGVYRFKRGFNVYIEELIGDFYKPINKVKYWLFNTLNTIRKNVKNKLMLLKAVTWWMSQPLFIVTSDRDKLQYSVGKF